MLVGHTSCKYLIYLESTYCCYIATRYIEKAVIHRDLAVVFMV